MIEGHFFQTLKSFYRITCPASSHWLKKKQTRKWLKEQITEEVRSMLSEN
jgi:hypothetical protein